MSKRQLDIFPPERIEAIKAKKSLEETVPFIKSYHFSLENDFHVPLHWHQFASDILYRAAVLAESNPEAREGPLAKEMGLQGRESKYTRDVYIAYCVQVLINKGNRVGVAQKKVANKVFKVNGRNCKLSLDSIKSIWRKRNKRATEEMAEEYPNTDI